MTQMKKKIEDIMDDVSDGHVSVASYFLQTLSIGYLGAVKFRNYLYDRDHLGIKKLPCKVVAVGNLAVGGTGKTPMTIYIAKRLQARGYKVCVISRGYKGKSEKEGGIVSDGKKILLPPEAAGDEPFMMARALQGIPVLVGKNRYVSGKIAVEKFKAQIIVADDAFQHRRLFRDMDIVLLDAEKPLGNGRVLPGGRLREPVAGLSRSHAIVFTRWDKDAHSHDGRYAPILRLLEKQPVFHAGYDPYIFTVAAPLQICGPDAHPSRECIYDVADLKGKRVVAFSGIAVNNNFKEALQSLCVDMVDFHCFPDHHTYMKEDLEWIVRTAALGKAAFLITTEKDFVKVPCNFPWPIPIVVMGVKITMGEEEKAFEQLIMDHLDS